MNRGKPRIQYERTVVLLPPSYDNTWAKATIDATWLKRYTVTNSADDSGIGDLAKRTVLAINPHVWPGDQRLEEFFWEHYPGVRFIPIVTVGQFGLTEKLQYVCSTDELLNLAQYTTWQRNPHWSSAKLTGVDCNSTIDKQGCFMSGMAVAQRRLGIRPKATPETVNNELGPNGFNGCDVNYDAARDNCGLHIVRHLSSAIGLREWIEAGNVAFIEVQPKSLQHFVVAVAYQDGDFVVIDPLYGDMIQLRDRYVGVETWREIQVAKPSPPVTLNVKGVHGSPILSPPPIEDQDYWIKEMKAMEIGWYKALNPGNGNEHLQWYAKLIEAGISPIIRFYVAEAFPYSLPSEFYDVARELSKLATPETPIYVEPFNEPNLPDEWRSEWRDRVDYHDPEIISLVNEQWYEAALSLVAMGVVPLYPAMAPTNRNGNHPKYSSVEFYRYGAKYLADNHYEKMKDMLAKKEVGIAVHISPFTRPLDFNPYNPGFVDDMCIRGWEPAYDRFQLEFGLENQELLMISTEGGAYSPEHIEDLEWGPAYSEAEWAQRTLEVYKYIQEETPLFALCTWILTDQGVHDTRWKKNGWYIDKQPRAIVDVLKGA